MSRILPGSLVLTVVIALAGPARAQDLLDAVKEGDTAAVAQGLTAAPEPRTLSRPLYFAAQRGHSEIVGLLLDAGADPNTSYTFGAPLHSAARENDTESLRLLLEAGATPDLTTGDLGRSALHDAAERGATEAARLLLDHGADVNFRNSLGQPAIHAAATAGQTDMVDLLRAHGAAPNRPEPLADGDLDTADLALGQLASIGCNTCHALASDRPATGVHTGPPLTGIFGAEKARRDDFPYSDAMQAQEGEWTAEELNVFLADPTGSVPGTLMLRVPEMTREERVALIAYLRAEAPQAE